MLRGRWKRALLALIVVAVVFAGTVVILAIRDLRRFEAGIYGPEYRFAVDQSLVELSEEHALELAREALRRDGYDLDTWKPIARLELTEWGDRYFNRGSLDSNAGWFEFRREGKDWWRLVRVELNGDHATSRVTTPKTEDPQKR